MCETPPAGFPFPTVDVQSILLILSERYPEKVAMVVERLYRGLWGEGNAHIVTTDGFMSVLEDVFGVGIAGEILEAVSSFSFLFFLFRTFCPFCVFLSGCFIMINVRVYGYDGDIAIDIDIVIDIDIDTN